MPPTVDQVKEALSFKLQNGEMSPDEARSKLQSYYDKFGRGEGSTPVPAQEQQNIVPPAMYNLYKSGNMSPEERSVFAEKVNTGELVMPKEGSGIIGEEQDEALQQAELVGEEGRFYQQGQPLAPQVREWPDQINGVPVVTKDNFMKYQRWELDEDEKLDLERELEKGIVTLPPGLELNKPKTAEDKTYHERISEIFSGEERQKAEGGKNPSLSHAPQMQGYTNLIAATASTEEKMMMAKAKGMQTTKTITDEWGTEKEIQIRDFMGMPIAIDPNTGKRYSIKAGFTGEDAAGLALTAGPSLAAGPLGFGSKTILQRMAVEGAKEAVIQTGIESLQEKEGASFDKSDILVSGMAGMAGDALAGIINLASGGSKGRVGRLLKMVTEGGESGTEAAKQLQKESPELVKKIADKLEMKVTDTPGALPTVAKKELNLKESIESYGKAVKSVGPESEVAIKDAEKSIVKAMNWDADMISDYKESGIFDQLTPREAVSRTGKGAKESRELIDATIPTGDSKFASEINSKDLFNKLESIGGSKDLGKVSRDIKDIHDKYMKRLQYGKADKPLKGKALEEASVYDLGSDDLYSRIKNRLPKDFTANPETTLGILKDKLDAWKTKYPEGFETLEDGKRVSSPFSPFEKKVISDLSPEYGTVNNLDVVDVNQPYARLDDLRKEAGSMTRPGQVFTDTEVAKANTLYKSLTKDADIALDEAGGEVGKDIRGDWIAAKRKIRLRKGIEDTLIESFGKEIKTEFVDKTVSAIKGASKTQVDKLDTMLKSVPMEKRGEFLSSGLVQAIDPKEPIKAGKKLAQLWAGLENSDKAMMIFKKHLGHGFDMLKTQAKISKRLDEAQTTLKSYDMSKDAIKEAVDPKLSMLANFSEKMKSLAGGFLSVKALAASTGGFMSGVGGYGFVVGLADGVKRVISGSEKDVFKALTDFMNSKELLDLIGSTENTDVFIKKLSKSEKTKKFMSLIGESIDEAKIGLLIRSSMRSKQLTGQEEK